MKTVSLALAKELKEKGYPQTSSIWYASEPKTDGKNEFYEPIEEPVHETECLEYAYRKDVTSPTADEILDELPRKIDKHKDRGHLEIDKSTKNKWQLLYTYRQMFERKTLADAAATMWLYLKENDLLDVK